MVHGLKTPRPQAREPRPGVARRWLLGLTLGLVGGGDLWGQEFSSPSIGRAGLLTPLGGLAEPAEDPNATRPLLRLAGMDFSANAVASGLYNDNIGIQSENLESDYIVAVLPELQARNSGGEKALLSVSYSPGLFFFLKHSDFNNVGHRGDLNASYSFPKLRLSLSQSVSLSQGAGAMTSFTTENAGYVPTYNAATQVRSFQSFTMAAASYALGEKTSVGLQGGLTLSDYRAVEGNGGALYGSRQWSAGTSLQRRLSERLTAGVGVSASYWDVDASPKQSGQQLFLHGGYQLTAKMDVSGSVAVEEREYQGGGSSDPGLRFVVAGSYKPRPRLTVALDLHRSENPSISDAGENYVQTGVALTLSQQLGQKTVVSVGGAYDDAQFVAIRPGLQTDRADQYYSFHSSYAYQVTDRLTLSLFYTYRRQDSTSERFYRNNIAGLSTVFRF